MRIVAPPRLRRGDRIGVAAPAGPPDRARLEKGLALLERRGFVVEPGRHLFDRHAYLAGRDADRLDDLNGMLRDPSLRAIWFARGGYGLHRLVAGIDFRALRRSPKALIGYSDITVIQSAAWRRMRLASFQAPMVQELGDRRAYDAGALWRMLQGGGLRLRFPAGSIVRPGNAGGPLVGGCLSILVSLVGKPYEPPLDGAILYWEEVNEPPFRIDRMLAHLRLSGRLARLNGMVVGRLVDCRARRAADQVDLRDILAVHLAGTGYPVVIDLPAGHGPGKTTLPIGFPARLDTAACRLSAR